jgi:hypothetical protein
MGALNILDRNAQPDQFISDAQLFAKAAHESRLLETSDAFKRAHARWRDRLFQWNADTIAFYAIAGYMTQDAIMDEEERIGIKPVEPTYAFPKSDNAKYGKRYMDKRPRSTSSSNRRWLVTY